ncbi:hypothetical protein HYS10_00950 [Candidatus Collierbacteria bacterium]|nr:hypothetical protein [Candidatus Collierbacteria bacterium]
MGVFALLVVPAFAAAVIRDVVPEWFVADSAAAVRILAWFFLPVLASLAVVGDVGPENLVFNRPTATLAQLGARLATVVAVLRSIAPLDVVLKTIPAGHATPISPVRIIAGTSATSASAAFEILSAFASRTDSHRIFSLKCAICIIAIQRNTLNSKQEIVNG